ncbi:MAG TPA: MFS transporter [Acidimicrobiia bacterium]|nr:MFS transporter [Acidimicrobiia bacterium]
MSTDPRFTGPTPFARLAATQAASIAGDACVTVSLAGSLFFTAPTSAARSSVLLYLALTLAPFAVIAPIVGPALDRTRGGRRMIVFIAFVGRMILAFLLARHLNSLLLYPEAFGILVLGKAHSIAKSSLVPGLVKGQGEFVQANSRLALISVVGAIAAGLPAAGLAKLAGSEYVLIVAGLIFFVGTLLALKLPRPAPEPAPEGEALELEKEELHAPSVILAGSAMGLLRGSVGFYTFFLAFQLKDSVFSLGFALAASGIGGLLGVIAAPYVRKRVREEIILAGALLAPAVMALLSARDVGRIGFAATALVVAVGAASGRVGFDSILQRDAPDAVRGRSFARFETRFQLIWVVGALLGLLPVDAGIGMLGLAGVMGFAGVSYVLGMRAGQARVDRNRRRSERTRAAVRTGVRGALGRFRRRRSGERPKRPRSEARR